MKGFLGRHVHEWEYMGTTPKPRTASTEVLRRCRECGKPSTTHIDGLWTLDQLNGKQGR